MLNAEEAIKMYDILPKYNLASTLLERNPTDRRNDLRGRENCEKHIFSQIQANGKNNLSEFNGRKSEVR